MGRNTERARGFGALVRKKVTALDLRKNAGRGGEESAQSISAA